MANVSSHGRLPGDYRHRADEIHVHRASWWQAFGPLLGLLALLALVALGAWAYMRGRARSAAPARPEVTEPQGRTAAPQELPAMPPPPAVEPPSTEPPAAAVAPMDKPSEQQGEEQGLAAPKEPEAPAAPEAAAAETQSPATEMPKSTAPVAATPAVEMTDEQLGAAVAQADPCSATTVYFPTDAVVFKEGGVDELNNVADCLKANPARVVLLQGSADPRGDDAHNRELAKGRAEAVAEQLWAHGVAPGQIAISVVPSSCSENDAACWQNDRRVKATLSP